MPIMRGLAPIRRTLKYLESSNLVLKDRFKILAVHYNLKEDSHNEAREFVFWHLAQIKYKNPDLQVMTFPNLFPTPFIRVFTKSLEDIILDIDGQTKEEICERIKRVLCKSDEKLKEEELAKEKKDNPANFGWGCDRQCLCEMYGQAPCPGVISLPNHMRGKFKDGVAEE